jgi:hypothetical protein
MFNKPTGYDLESSDARQPDQLKIAERMPQPRVLPMPHMSDGELYLRLGIPDGLQNDGSQPEHNGIPQHEHANGQRSIKSDTGE